MNHDLTTPDGVLAARSDLIAALWDCAVSGDLQAADVVLAALNAQSRDLRNQDDGLPSDGRLVTVHFPKVSPASEGEIA